MSSDEFEWYGIVNGEELEQGDFLDQFPILEQPIEFPTDINEITEDFELVPDVVIRNVIIVTQSCDFAKMQDTDVVNLCPRLNYQELYGKNKWKNLIAGRETGVHLLNKCSLPGHNLEYQIVDLTRVFSVPFGYVKRFARDKGDRIRLQPPYREHLAQAFARRFMRVGLPIDLPREYPYTSD